MDNLKRSFLFYAILAVDFYAIPWIIKDTGSAIMILFIIVPVICFLTSIAYGIKNGFHFWYALIVAAIFAPSIFIFYNSSAWVYTIAYGIVALLGNLIALPFHKKIG